MLIRNRPLGLARLRLRLSELDRSTFVVSFRPESLQSETLIEGLAFRASAAETLGKAGNADCASTRPHSKLNTNLGIRVQTCRVKGICEHS